MLTKFNIYLFIYLFFTILLVLLVKKSINDAPGKILQQKMIKSLSST